MQPPARPIADQKLDEIGHLVTRHRPLIKMIVAEGNRRMSLRGSAQRDVDVTVRFLRDRLGKIDEQMKILIAKNPSWRWAKSIPEASKSQAFTIVYEFERKTAAATTASCDLDKSRAICKSLGVTQIILLTVSCIQ